MAKTYGDYNRDWTDRYHYTAPSKGAYSAVPYIGYQKGKQQRRALAEAQAHKREWAKGPKWEEGLAYGTVNVTEDDTEFMARMDRRTSTVRKDALKKKKKD
jgi:hypothetical protein